jgi:hypothetical protein
MHSARLTIVVAMTGHVSGVEEFLNLQVSCKIILRRLLQAASGTD